MLPTRASLTRVLLVLPMTLVLLASCSTGGSAVRSRFSRAGTGSAAGSPALAPARDFLARYVDPDGRVVRRDQGGDTVSEGQGYGMLLAIATSDRSAFERIWQWTEQHLQQPSHLFASSWQDGAIVDGTPAADADVQIAWALTLAAHRFGRHDLLGPARAIAVAVAEHEVGYDDTGAPLIAAGPWAVHTGSPTVVEPGYWTPPAVAALARLTGDNRWRALITSTPAHLRTLTGDGASLPPDWARLGGGQPAEPVPAPGGAAPVQFGPDGMRTVVWSACGRDARPLLARWWQLLSGSAAAAPLARALDGSVTSPDVAALSAVAAAAAARATGHRGVAGRLLDRAASIDRKYPTYYGAAWLALGRVLLDTRTLADC